MFSLLLLWLNHPGEQFLGRVYISKHVAKDKNCFKVAIFFIYLFIDCFDVASDELLINHEAAFHLFMEVLKCTVHAHYVQISA